MFDGLTRFGRRRSPLEALGFYLAWCCLTLVTGLAIGGAASVALDATGRGEAEGLVVIRAMDQISVLFSLALSYAVLRQKRLLWHPACLALFVVGALGAMVLGAVVGTIAPAILTTCPSRGRRQRHAPPAPPLSSGSP